MIGLENTDKLPMDGEKWRDVVVAAIDLNDIDDLNDTSDDDGKK